VRPLFDAIIVRAAVLVKSDGVARNSDACATAALVNVPVLGGPRGRAGGELGVGRVISVDSELESDAVAIVGILPYPTIGVTVTIAGLGGKFSSNEYVGCTARSHINSCSQITAGLDSSFADN
jgi:hypothetical protein